MTEQSIVREVVGRVASWASDFWRRAPSRTTVDYTIPDYHFWDRLRRGMLRDYEFAGLFCKPIIAIVTAGVMSDGFTPELELEDGASDARTEHTNRLLKKFTRRVHAELVTMVQDGYALGDQYVVVNPDGSISIPPPETVFPQWDELDYRTMTSCEIRTRTEYALITDRYTPQQREVTVEWNDSDRDDEVFTYDNLFGRLPIVHFANDRSSNETHGRPIYEALLRLLGRYDALFQKGLDGAEVMGNPIPAFEGIDDFDEFLANNETDVVEEWTDADGRRQERVSIAFDKMMTVILGKGAQFRFVSPPKGFTSDIREMLKAMFLLILEFTEIPEAVWGGELSSARATAEQQMLPFYQMIQSRRNMLAGAGADVELGVDARGGFLEVYELWLTARSFTDPQVLVAPVRIEWPDLYESAEEFRLKWVEFLKGFSLITDETAVGLSRMVDNPEQEVQQAREQAQQSEDARFEQALADAEQAAQSDDDAETAA